MKAIGIASEVHNCLDLLVNHGLAIVTNPVVRERVGAETRITWGGRHGSSILLTAAEFATVSEYCGYLQHGAYSAILVDGGLLQISYDSVGSRVVGHRLCFYPCPFEVDVDLLQSEPILDVIELYRGRGDESLRLRSPIRFDYSSKAATEGHPASHVHLIKASCRCPVVAPLSLGHFLRFVFKHFYPLLWAQHEFLRKWPQRLGTRTIVGADEGMLHLACRR